MLRPAPAEAVTRDADAGTGERERTLVWWALGVAVSSRLFIFLIGFLARSTLPIRQPHLSVVAQPSVLYGGVVGRLLDGWASYDAGLTAPLADGGRAQLQ